MFTRIVIVMALTLFAFAAVSAAPTVVVNGKAVAVPMIEKDGKAYVDAAALMKVLGGSAAYDAKAHKVTINSKAAAPAAQPAKPATPGAAGSVQLPGDNGELGKVYTMRKGNPLYFSLKKAEYSTTRLRIGDTLYVPKANEKLLVLHFTVQNPLKGEEQYVRWDSLAFTAVDAQNTNHEAIEAWGDEEKHESFAMNVKPAQTLAVYTAIMVPAKGVVPKLMVLPTDDSPVLRFDLRGKVTSLAAPFADPDDTNGATAREIVPAEMGKVYPYDNYDVTVEKIEYTTKALGEYEPAEDTRLGVLTLLVKNQSPADQYFRWDALIPTLTTADGEEMNYRTMLLATANRDVGQNLKPAQEMRVRILFDVPTDAKPELLTIKESEDGRAYAIPLQ